MALVVPHDPAPVVTFQVFLPAEVVPSEELFAEWRFAAGKAWKELADERLFRAVSLLFQRVPFREMVRIVDASKLGMLGPELDAKVASSPSSSLLGRIRGAPSALIGAQNRDEHDPFPLLLAHLTATTGARMSGGVVYVSRSARLWDPQTKPPRPVYGASALELVRFTCSADDDLVRSTGMTCFGLPELSWRAPAGTDVAIMTNLLRCTASRLLRLRRTVGRRSPGMASLDVPSPLPICLADVAWAWGLPSDHFAEPELEIAAMPLRLDVDLEVTVDSSAEELNRWFDSVRAAVASHTAGAGGTANSPLPWDSGSDMDDEDEKDDEPEPVRFAWDEARVMVGPWPDGNSCEAAFISALEAHGAKPLSEHVRHCSIAREYRIDDTWWLSTEPALAVEAARSLDECFFLGVTVRYAELGNCVVAVELWQLELDDDGALVATTSLGEEDDDRDALSAVLDWEVKLAMRAIDARDEEPRSERALFYSE